MNLGLFFDVFNPLGFLYAAATGIGFGATVLLAISLRYPGERRLTALHTGILAFLASAAAGSLFFAGQVVQAIATDPLWPRAVGRMTLWEVFSLGIGVGLGVARSFAR